MTLKLLWKSDFKVILKQKRTGRIGKNGQEPEWESSGNGLAADRKRIGGILERVRIFDIGKKLSERVVWKGDLHICLLMENGFQN